MAYTINLTDGSQFATITDGTVNTSSSLTLIGKNYAGYGQFLDDNFIQMLENFSSASSGGNPTVAQLASPLTGQLWWDKTNSLLKVYSGSGWKTISSATASSSQPSPSIVGDLWYDTTNQQLKVCSVAGNPGTFIVVGPAFTSAEGTAGAVPETINDSGATPHFVTSLYVNNTRVAIVSKDASFTPAAPVNTTFPTIYPGITLTNVNSPVFAGSATNAQTLDSLDSLDFMRATANAVTTGTLKVLNNTGLYVGTGNVFNVNISGNDAQLKSDISNGNLTIQANVAGTTYNVAQALGASGTFAVGNALTIGTTASATGNVTGGNIRTGGEVSATGNVTGGNVNTTLVAATTLSATGNVQGGNLRTGGLISATGNITSAANIAGTFFIGNGSQLSGLSAAVSVQKITNGTSEVNVGASGGNANVSIGGTSNVVVFTNTTTYFAGNVSVPAIEKTGVSNVGNIGQIDNWFNKAFVTSYQAQYADVAERFAADEVMDAGTVVELGGEMEITKSLKDLSENVFGVISTKAAYLMNGGAGPDETHPPVAMTGRVPVKVTGVVNKGDRLVSAGNGIARAAKLGEATSFNVIGRALESKTTSEEGTVEAIVATK